MSPTPIQQRVVELESLLPLDDNNNPQFPEDYDDDDLGYGHEPSGPIFHTQRPPTTLQKAFEWLAVQSTKRTARWTTSYTARRKLPLRTTFFLCLQLPFIFIVVFLALTPVLFPSYSNPPIHYLELRRRTLESTYPGRANVDNQKVYIAASIYDEDGTLAGGAWGQRLTQLVDILGPDNVFLSIYEDNPSSAARDALDSLSLQLSCKSA